MNAAQVLISQVSQNISEAMTADTLNAYCDLL